jgi:hypothetical protein
VFAVVDFLFGVLTEKITVVRQTSAKLKLFYVPLGIDFRKEKEVKVKLEPLSNVLSTA